MMNIQREQMERDWREQRDERTRMNREVTVW